MSGQEFLPDIPDVILRPVAVLALHLLANSPRDAGAPAAHMAAAAIEHELIALTWKAAATAQENALLRVERDDARDQVVADRAELDGYRKAYGPLSNERVRRTA